MRTRLAAVLALLLMSVGAVACDDTTEGLQEDAEEIQEGAEDALDDLEEGDG